MRTQIYINLPVKNLVLSSEFFGALGYSINPQFSNEEGACIIISETICVMLLTEPFFATFTNKNICDARASTEVLLCLSCDSREDVDEKLFKAVDAGASVPRPAQDFGFMYSRAFEDLDGHVWELVYMDPNTQEA